MDPRAVPNCLERIAQEGLVEEAKCLFYWLDFSRLAKAAEEQGVLGRFDAALAAAIEFMNMDPGPDGETLIDVSMSDDPEFVDESR